MPVLEELRSMASNFTCSFAWINNNGKCFFFLGEHIPFVQISNSLHINIACEAM